MRRGQVAKSTPTETCNLQSALLPALNELLFAVCWQLQVCLEAIVPLKE